MYVIVNDGPSVCASYAAAFAREGVAAINLLSEEFESWLSTAPGEDVGAVRGFVVGETAQRKFIARIIRHYSDAPIFAVLDKASLDATVELLSANFDDVFQKAVHVKEILARTHAVWRRVHAGAHVADWGESERLQVFFNGRDVEIDGEPVVLPRRERQILEYLVENRTRRVTRTQLFSAIYGVFHDEVDDKAIESHMSRLRKRLRGLLGFDPIDAKRFVGYQYMGSGQIVTQGQPRASLDS